MKVMNKHKDLLKMIERFEKCKSPLTVGKTGIKIFALLFWDQSYRDFDGAKIPQISIDDS